MQKRLCVCGFVLGGLLVVLAAGLIAYADHGSTLDSAQRLRLAHIAGETDGCLTCHDAPAAAAQVHDSPVALARDHAPQIDAQLRHSVTLNTAHTDTARVMLPDLQDMAQRILDLPHDDPGQVAQVNALTSDFLAAYDALAAPASDEVGGTLALLARIDDRLRTLEHQANPVRLAAESASVQAPQSFAAVPVSTAPHTPAAFAGDVPELVASESVCGWARAEAAARIPWLVMHDVQRRGPPEAHDNLFLFVLERRLPSLLPVDAQSFFVFQQRANVVLEIYEE